MTDAERRSGLEHLAMVLLVLGVALIAISLVPFTSLAKRAWTIEDSESFGKVTRELHQSTQDSPEQSGRTDKELARYRANLEQQYKRLNNRLEQARQAPQRWSRILWWSGAGLTAIGAMLHLSRRA